MKILITFLIALFVITSCTQTVPNETRALLTESSAEDEGMSEARLGRIDAMLEEAIEQDQIPGAVALVARNGKIVYHKAFGMADNESNRSLQRDDIFRIASQTKAITSTAVMMLWEEGKFRLDDPISK